MYAELRALKVLNSEAWRGVDKDDIMPAEYKQYFKVILAYFAIQPDAIFDIADWSNAEGRASDIAFYMAEAKIVGELLRDLVHTNHSITMVNAWAIIYGDHRLSVPNFTRVACAVLCTPVHSAAVERGFSIHRVLKHRLTNRLLLTTLDSAMRVKMLVKNDCIFTFDLSDVVIVYEASHPRNGAIPRLLNKLHKAVNEAINLPTKLADGVDFDDIDVIDVDTGSEDDITYEPPSDDAASEEDNADWDAIDFDSEPELESLDEDVEFEDLPAVAAAHSDVDE